jgi:hypothetical protein
VRERERVQSTEAQFIPSTRLLNTVIRVSAGGSLRAAPPRVIYIAFVAVASVNLYGDTRRAQGYYLRNGQRR